MTNFIVSYQWIHTFVCPLIAYVLLAIVGPRKGAYVVFVFAFGYMSTLHLYRQWTDYLGWSFDVSTQMMIIVQKLVALGWNYHDGANPKATHSQRIFSISRLPSLLEFYGWIYMPSVITMGPFIEYTDFLLNTEALPESPVMPSLKVLLEAVVYLGIMQLGSAQVPNSVLRDESFLASSPVYIYSYLMLCAFVMHFKYYFGFKMAEGAAIMSGLGYDRGRGADPIDPTVDPNTLKWSAAQGIAPYRFLFSQSYRESAQVWNMQTNKWIRRYSYERMPASIGVYGSYAVSAFWHGFYPGYYLFFLTVAPVSSVHRWVRATIRPIVLGYGPTAKFVYDIASWVATFFTLNYFVSSFMLLDFTSSIALFRSMHFFIHIICFGAFLLTFVWRRPPTTRTPPKPVAASTLVPPKKDN